MIFSNAPGTYTILSKIVFFLLRGWPTYVEASKQEWKNTGLGVPKSCSISPDNQNSIIIKYLNIQSGHTTIRSESINHYADWNGKNDTWERKSIFKNLFFFFFNFSFCFSLDKYITYRIKEYLLLKELFKIRERYKLYFYIHTFITKEFVPAYYHYLLIRFIFNFKVHNVVILWYLKFFNS